MNSIIFENTVETIKNIKIVKKNVTAGYKKNIKKLELEEINNFKPSANGCRKPNKPVKFGPFLLWTLLITFLSINVNIAIHNSINIILKIKNNNFSNKK